MPKPTIGFSVQARPQDLDSWVSVAKRVESLGFQALLAPDHPGLTREPFAALATAAAVTHTIQLGPYVLNTGVREPLHIASATATLDSLSGGRARLGMGAGHTPAEWAMLGRRIPGPADRVDRLIECTNVVRQLLDGETVTTEGRFLSTNAARLDHLESTRTRVPIVIGGNHPRLLAFAARHADVVGLSGLGRTLADGHRHEVRWGQEALTDRIQLVSKAARAAGVTPKIEVFVQHVALTDTEAEARHVAEQLAGAIPGLAPEDALETPFLMVGTRERLADRIAAHATSGITQYVVRSEAIEQAVSVMDALA